MTGPSISAVETSGLVSGRGLFSGQSGTVTFERRAPGSGLVFLLHDGSREIDASVDRVAGGEGLPAGLRSRCTMLASVDGAGRVMTVEHVLSACAGLGVWDVAIRVSGPEVPIGDGSASAFVGALRRLQGSGERNATEREPLRVKDVVRVVDPRDADSWIEARPRAERGCAYAYELDYGSAMRGVLGVQRATIVLDGVSTAETYAREVAPARTFCLEAEAKAMQALGLFKDFSPRELLVIGERGPIENAWRFENEAARHKLLDLIGDLALVGGPIQAEIVAHRSGHALNHAMARAIVAHARASA